MRKWSYACAVSWLVFAISCGGDKEDPAANMPVAQTWSSSSGALGTAGRDARTGFGAGGSDPHAGLGIQVGGSDPHAGLGLEVGGSDPHAGLGLGFGSDAGAMDPHAGLDMGLPGGLQPPDPDRRIDTSKFLKGTISLSPKYKGRLAGSSILFVSVRPINKATGESIGAPLAVERYDVSALPMEFQLDERNTMVAGTRFEGDVEVAAWLDGDGEATSKTRGDIMGSVQATIPAQKLRLVLDRMVE